MWSHWKTSFWFKITNYLKPFAIILIGHSLPRVCFYVLVIIKLKSCGSLSILLDRGFKIPQDLIQDCIEWDLLLEGLCKKPTLLTPLLWQMPHSCLFNKVNVLFFVCFFAPLCSLWSPLPYPLLPLSLFLSFVFIGDLETLEAEHSFCLSLTLFDCGCFAMATSLISRQLAFSLQKNVWLSASGKSSTTPDPCFPVRI